MTSAVGLVEEENNLVNLKREIQLAVAWRRRRLALWSRRDPSPHENCFTKAKTIPLLWWLCYHVRLRWRRRRRRRRRKGWFRIGGE